MPTIAAWNGHGRTIVMATALMAAAHAVLAQTGPARFGQRFAMNELRVEVIVPDSTTWTGTSRNTSGTTIAQVLNGNRDGSTFVVVALPRRGQTCESAMTAAAAERTDSRPINDLPYAPTGTGPGVRLGPVEAFCLFVYGSPWVFSVMPNMMTPAQQQSVRRLLQAVQDIAGRPLPPAAAQFSLNYPLNLSHLGITVPASQYWSVTSTTGPGGEQLDEVSRSGRNIRDRYSMVLARQSGAASCAEALAAATGRNGNLRQSSEHFPQGWVASSHDVRDRRAGCLQLRQGVLVATISKGNDEARPWLNELLTGVRLAAEQQWGLQ